MADLMKSLKMTDGSEFEFIGKTWFASCNTSASTAAKAVTINGFTSADIIAGTVIFVKFNNGNTATTPTLNINSIGAKNIRVLTGVTGFNLWIPTETVALIYDGSYWVQINGDWQGKWFGTCTTADTTQTKAVSVGYGSAFQLTAGVRVTVKFNNAQNYNGTPKLNVNGTGAKEIRRTSDSSAGYHEWTYEAILDFVYDGSYWVIVGGDFKQQLETSLGNIETLLAAI